MGPDRSIDWARWLVYLLAGVPLVALIFFARDRVTRLVGVTVVALFIQDSFIGRRYLWGFSLAPSLIVAYIGLLSQVLAQRRLPRLGVYGPLWAGLLFAGLVSIVAGSIGTNLMPLHVKQFQFCYLEGLVFFLYGAVALRKPEELRAFFHWTVALGALMALQHFFVATTGFRFQRSAEAVAADVYYAGVLDNGNNLGSFWVLTIPVTLAIALSRDTSPRMRLVCYAALVPMAGSLLLTGSRGGFLFTLSMLGLMAFVSGVRAGRAVAIGVLGTAFALVGYLVISTFVGTQTQEVFDQMREEGTESSRLQNFAVYGRIMLDHPFGNGMAPEAMGHAASRYGVLMTSAHNIYLDVGTQAGFLGLAFFLAMAASLVLRNRRAARLARDSIEAREGLDYLFLFLVGALAVGTVEPILASSNKLNNYFFLVAGLSVAAANQVFDARRTADESAPAAAAGGADLRVHASV